MSADPAPPRLGRSAVLLLCATVVACRLLAARSCPIYDDAFITFRYARHLAQGLGLVFNPGAAWEPVLGTTTPLYALLMAGFAALGAPLAEAARGVNALFDAGSAALLVALLGGRRVAATVAVLVFAGMPQVARISAGGMEAPLFCLLALAACHAHARARPLQSGAWAALACVVRPEGVLLVGVLALSLAAARRGRDLARFAAPVAAVGLVSVGVLTWVYGSPIPQSVTAKSASHTAHGGPLLLGRWTLILREAYLPHLAYLPLLPLVVWGFVRTLRGAPGPRAFSIFALAIPAAYLTARPHTWGWYYYVPLTGWVLWLAEGAAALVAARLPALERGRLGRAWPALPAVVLLVAVAVTTRALPSNVPENVYRPLASWAAAADLERGHHRILASDIGIVGWVTEATILDTEGLTWPGASEYDSPLAMIEALEPEYLLFVAEEPRLGPWYARPDLRARYVPEARFAHDGATEPEPALADLPPDWVQDYVLYRRADLAPVTFR